MSGQRPEVRRERASAADVGEKLAAYEAGKRAILESAQSSREYEEKLAELVERLGV